MKPSRWYIEEEYEDDGNWCRAQIRPGQGWVDRWGAQERASRTIDEMLLNHTAYLEEEVVRQALRQKKNNNVAKKKLAKDPTHLEKRGNGNQK